MGTPPAGTCCTVVGGVTGVKSPPATAGLTVCIRSSAVKVVVPVFVVTSSSVVVGAVVVVSSSVVVVSVVFPYLTLSFQKHQERH